MKRFASACLAGLLLAACGGEEKKSEESALRDFFEGKGGMPPGMTGDGPDPTADWAKLGQIELTDEMMGNYVKLIEKAKNLRGRPDAGLLQAYSLDWRQWLAISTAITRAEVATGKGSLIENYEKQLANARKRLAEAPEDRKEAYESMVKGYEDALAGLEKALPDATDLDRKNHALVQRWMDRIKAAGAGK